jgi:hypothetical protein
MNASSLLKPLLLGAGFGLTFLLGRASLGDAGGGELQAQGRQPNNPAPPTPTPTPEPAQPIVYTEDNGQSSAAANGFLAVTGSYGVGTSVLYLVDTNTRQLAVYEARGGSMDQRRIVLVGARRIDLDLQLRGYNDRSEYEYDQLQQLFDRHDKKGGSARPEVGPEVPGRK